MRLFAITVAYNEAFFLPRWVEYYGRQIGPENLYIIDHGSTDLSTVSLGAANVIRVPRTEFHDVAKAQAVSGLHASLLNYYDAGVVTDTDEFLVADPRKHRGLREFFGATEHKALCPIGLELLHLPEAEGPFQPYIPILAQRSAVFFSTAMCKHSYSAEPTRFGGGLHSSNNAPRFNPDFYLIHAKNFDADWRASRQRVTRSWDWPGGADFGTHARLDDEASKASADSLVRRYSKAVVPGLDFSSEIARAVAGVTVTPSGQHVYEDRFFGDAARRLPDEFAGLF